MDWIGYGYGLDMNCVFNKSINKKYFKTLSDLNMDLDLLISQ